MAEKLEPGKIFVGGLSWDTNKESLSNYFKKYGEVCDSVIMVDARSALPRGFGFVTFKDHNSVQAVVNSDSHFLDGKKIDPKEAINKDYHAASQLTKSSSIENKVFIGGLPHGCKPEELKEFFAQFGEVQEVDIKMDRNTHKPRGFAFVEFDHSNSCHKACVSQFQFFKDKKIEVKPAENRNPSSHQLQVSGQSAQSAISWSPQSYTQSTQGSYPYPQYSYSHFPPYYQTTANYQPNFHQSQATPSYQPNGPHTSLYQASQYPSNGAYPNTYSSNTYPHSNINYNHYGTYQQASYPQASQADSAAYPMGPSQQSSNPYYTSGSYPSNYTYTTTSGASSSGSMRW